MRQLNNYKMDFHKTLHRHSTPEEEFYDSDDTVTWSCSINVNLPLSACRDKKTVSDIYLPIRLNSKHFICPYIQPNHFVFINLLGVQIPAKYARWKRDMWSDHFKGQRLVLMVLKEAYNLTVTERVGSREPCTSVWITRNCWTPPPSLDVLDGKQFLKLLNLSTTVPIKNAEDFLLWWLENDCRHY